MNHARRWTLTILLFGAATLFSPEAVADAHSDTVAGIAAYNSGDYATAFQLLSGAAKHGDADAEVNLGYMYARGQFVLEDHGQSLRLYRLSAAQGNGEGLNAVAYVYAFGTPADLPQAVRWFCRAIAAGDPRAMNNLGNLHWSGRGVPQDPSEARNLWQQASDRGDQNATYNLGKALLWFVDGANQSLGHALVESAAMAGQPAAIKWLRSTGFRGLLPDPVDTEGMMALAPRPARAGTAKECVMS
jgi:TPR repeat protein